MGPPAGDGRAAHRRTQASGTQLRPGLLKNYSNLAAYVARGEAGPAYKRAFDAQLAITG